jgi:hypothetical protein
MLNSRGNISNEFPGRACRCAVLLGILLAAGLSPAHGEWSVAVESGVVFSAYNDVRIPNATGTEISLTDDLETDPSPYLRVRLTTVIAGRHTLSLLVAPLRLTADGSVEKVVDFNNEEFPAGVPLEARYRFDSYRLTYRYRLVRSERVTAGLGFTAKIRDAEVGLRGAGKKTEYLNTGFVPLLNFSVRWSFACRLAIILEGDALASPGGQGRVEDVLLAFRYERDHIGLSIGYRLLEGGADVGDVYNFTMLHYVAAGMSFTY